MNIDLKPALFRWAFLASAMSAALIAGCGGGGAANVADVNSSSNSGSSTVVVSTPTVSPTVVTSTDITLEGTAAFGAAYPVGSIVTAYDATNTVVGSATVQVNGYYNMGVPLSAKAPLVLKVQAPAGQEDTIEPLFSPCPAIISGRVNITPVTHAVAALLSPTGNPASLASEVQAGTAAVNSTTVADKKTIIINIIAPVRTAAGDNADPITGVFTPGQAGHDQVLDAIKINISPTNNGASSNIQITVIGAQTDNSQPFQVSFVAGASATIPSETIPAMTSTTLPQVGVSDLIKDLNTRIQACYALPKTTRTNWTNTAVVGTASNIVAPECRSIFFNSDPATYKNNSNVIASNQGWSGIFTKADDVTVTWDAGVYQYTINNPGQPNHGDVVYNTTWKASNTPSVVVNFRTDEYHTRKGADGKLYIIGNQSNWDVAVNARAEYRDFLHADFAKYKYRSSGYDLYVKNTGNIAQVVVTSPNTKTFVLKENAGNSSLNLVLPNGTLSNTTIIKLAAQFTNPTFAIGQTWTPSGTTTTVNVQSPKDIETSLFWANPLWTDAEILQIPAQGNWKFDFTLKDGTTFTTYRRVTSRAPTIAEGSSIVWPTWNTTFRNELTNAIAATGRYIFATTQSFAVSGSDGSDGWVVPTGAWLPLNFFASGRDPLNANAPFNDSLDFSTINRKTILNCSDQDGSGTGDQHCVGNQFKPGVFLNYIQLFTRNNKRVQLAVGSPTRNN